MNLQNIHYFFNGLLIGFSLAIPVGPIGVLCIRRTLAHGGRRGLLVGVSAASADMVYGIIASSGISLISNFITDEQYWIRFIGGIILLGLGYHTYRSHPASDKMTKGMNGHTRAFLSIFFLTLTNPMTLFAFAAVFAGIGLHNALSRWSSASLLIAGIFTGSLLWFFLLTVITRICKEKVTTQGVVLVNKISGVLLILFGLVAFVSIAFRF